MIVLETSALVAALLGEAERPRIVAALSADPHVVISAVSRYEALVVLRGKGVIADPEAEVDALLRSVGAEIIAFDAAHSSLAFAAYARFGKGSGSAARLNLADCAAYALAILKAAPLLYTGGDFAQTDIAAA